MKNSLLKFSKSRRLNYVKKTSINRQILIVTFNQFSTFIFHKGRENKIIVIIIIMRKLNDYIWCVYLCSFSFSLRFKWDERCTNRTMFFCICSMQFVGLNGCSRLNQRLFALHLNAIRQIQRVINELTMLKLVNISNQTVYLAYFDYATRSFYRVRLRTLYRIPISVR